MTRKKAITGAAVGVLATAAMWAVVRHMAGEELSRDDKEYVSELRKRLKAAEQQSDERGARVLSDIMRELDSQGVSPTRRLRAWLWRLRLGNLRRGTGVQLEHMLERLADKAERAQAGESK